MPLLSVPGVQFTALHFTDHAQALQLLPEGREIQSLSDLGVWDFAGTAGVVEGPSTPITKRQMTLTQRDQIVAEIERAFAGHLSVESDGFWYSGWAATAASMRSNLLDKGWNYTRSDKGVN